MNSKNIFIRDNFSIFGPFFNENFGKPKALFNYEGRELEFVLLHYSIEQIQIKSCLKL